jgi:type VI secretion system secreted protein Hcp
MAFHWYIAVKGTKQGQFKGESVKSGHGSKWSGILGFEYGVESPADTGSGAASGRRQHSPVTVTKENDPASPQILQAHSSREVLSEVVIQKLLRPLAGGGGNTPEVVVERITLTNAVISKVGRYTALPLGHTSHPKNGYQNLEFTFEDIKIEKIGA